MKKLIVTIFAMMLGSNFALAQFRVASNGFAGTMTWSDSTGSVDLDLSYGSLSGGYTIAASDQVNITPYVGFVTSSDVSLAGVPVVITSTSGTQIGAIGEYTFSTMEDGGAFSALGSLNILNLSITDGVNDTVDISDTSIGLGIQYSRPLSSNIEFDVSYSLINSIAGSASGPGLSVDSNTDGGSFTLGLTFNM